MFGTWQKQSITTADRLACTLATSSNMLILAGVLAVKRGFLSSPVASLDA